MAFVTITPTTFNRSGLSLTSTIQVPHVRDSGLEPCRLRVPVWLHCWYELHLHPSRLYKCTCIVNNEVVYGSYMSLGNMFFVLYVGKMLAHSNVSYTLIVKMLIHYKTMIFVHPLMSLYLNIV